MKTKELIQRLLDMGWRLDRIRGSHHQFEHPDAKRTLTVPVHGKEITDRLAKIILKQVEMALGKE